MTLVPVGAGPVEIPPKNKPRVEDAKPPISLALNVSPKSVTSPKLANVTNSMVLTWDGLYPPAKTPLVLLPKPAVANFAEDNSPNTCVLPNVDIVKKSISSRPLDGSPLPPNNPRVPRPVFDPVPPPKSGSINSN